MTATVPHPVVARPAVSEIVAPADDIAPAPADVIRFDPVVTTADITADDVETVRSRHVAALGLLDAPSDGRFDRLTRLARQVLGAPIATVTLVAGETAWFPSVIGMDVDTAPRCDTFCDVTVTEGRTVVVSDARLEPAFAALPSVTGDLHLRAYAGVPLVDSAGVTVGAFCVYDTRPRAFTDAELTTLSELARWAQDELVSSADMLRARAVQQALLPQRVVVLPGAEVAGLCVPSLAVGGDFYDWDVAHGTFVFSLVDVMGKGTAAALVAATVRALLRATGAALAEAVGRRAVVQPVGALRGGIGSVVRDVDRLVRGDLERTGSLVTGFIGQYDPATGTLHYADAGHGLTVLVRDDGTTRWLTSDDLPIGVDASARWSQQTVVLEPGDTVLCCSDGLFDLLGGTFEALKKIEALVRACPAPDELIEQVGRLTRRRTPTDDVTVVALRRLPA